MSRLCPQLSSHLWFSHGLLVPAIKDPLGPCLIQAAALTGSAKALSLVHPGLGVAKAAALISLFSSRHPTHTSANCPSIKLP